MLDCTRINEEVTVKHGGKIYTGTLVSINDTHILLDIHDGSRLMLSLDKLEEETSDV